MSGLLFVTANVLVLCGAVAAVRALKFTGIITSLLAVFTLAISQIVLSLLIAGGMLAALQPIPVLLINAFISALILLLIYASGSGGTVLAWRVVREKVIKFGAELLRDPWALLLTGLMLTEIGWLAFLGWSLPSFDYDGLFYHLPTVVSWLQAGKIGLNPYEIWSNVYPANTELFFTWLVLFFHNASLVRMGQLVFAGGGVLAVLGLGRMIGLKRTSSLAAGCLFFLTPAVALQTTTSYVDVAFASMFLVFFYFFFRFLKERELESLLLAGLAGGITIGMKSTGLAYVGICLLLLPALAVWRRQFHLRRTLGMFLLLGIPFLLLGSFWYLRTWAVYGNPLYPVTLHLLGFTFPGSGSVQELIIGNNVPKELIGRPWWAQVWFSWLSEPPMPNYTICTRDQAGNCLTVLTGYYNYDQRLGGFGIQWPMLELPAVVLFAAYSLYKRRFVFITMLFPFGLIFLVQPANWWSRYTLFLLVPGALALAYALEHLPRRWLTYLVQAVSLALVLISLYFSTFQSYYSPRMVKYALALPPQERTIGNLWYPQFRWVDTIPAGSHIALTGYTTEEWCVYPLFGAHLDNQVFLVQVHSYTGFLEALQPLQIQYLFTSATSIYARWADGDPLHFHLMSTSGTSRVYSVTL